MLNHFWNPAERKRVTITKRDRMPIDDLLQCKTREGQMYSTSTRTTSDHSIVFEVQETTHVVSRTHHVDGGDKWRIETLENVTYTQGNSIPVTNLNRAFDDDGPVNAFRGTNVEGDLLEEGLIQATGQAQRTSGILTQGVERILTPGTYALRITSTASGTLVTNIVFYRG